MRYKVARDERRGSALVASLFVVMAVSVLSVAYLQLSLSKNREGRSSVDAKRAFYVAEAGLSEAFTAIRMGRSGNVATEEEPAQFASGVYWVTAVEQDDDTCLLVSTGLCGSGRSSLSVVVDKTESSIQSLGVFGDDDVTIGEGALIDSYDSRLGEYGAQGYDPEWYEERAAADSGETEGGEGAGGQEGGGGFTPTMGFLLAPRDGSEEQVLGAAVGARLGGPQVTVVVVGGGGGTPVNLDITNTRDAADNGYTLGEWADVVADIEDVENLPRSSKISGNGDITLLGAPEGAEPTRILGDLRPGPDGTVTTESGVLVSGGTTPAEERTLMPVIEVPVLPDQGDKTLGRGFVIEDTEVAYGTLQAPAGTALVLRGPLKLTVEDLVIEAGAQLQIDTTNGPIELYATHYFGLEDGSEYVSTTRDPSQAMFVITADEWDVDGDGDDDSPTVLAASGEMHAVVFAPKSDLFIDADLEFFGSIAGRRIDIGAGAQVHFDTALESVAGGPLTVPKLAAWRMIDLPDAPIVKQRLDPVLWLKAQGVTPLPGDQRYLDDWLVIQYTCPDGHTHDYEGPKHLFDTSLVATTLSQTITAAPAGRLDAPADDYLLPIYGHASQLSISPFITLP